MKKITRGSSVIPVIVLAVLFAGCADILKSPVPGDLASGTGRAVISIGPRLDGARTFMPTESSSGYYEGLSYTFEFTAEGRDPVSGSMTDETGSVELEAGTWDLTITGKDEDGMGILSGSVMGIVITAGETKNVPVTLAAFTQSGTGTLTWSVTFPDDIIRGTLTVYPWDSETAQGTPVNLLDGAVGDEQKTAAGSTALPAGYYRLALDLYRADGVYHRSDIAQIYPDLTTAAEYTVAGTDFTPATVDGSKTSLADVLAGISGLADGANAVYFLTASIFGAEGMNAGSVSNTNGPVTVTIEGGGRTVSLGNTGSLITVGNNVTLIVRNITLRGRGSSVNNNAALVTVESGGKLELGTGARITGNRNYVSSSPSLFTAFGGGVYVRDGGTFTMSGGEISGNSVSAASSYVSYVYGGGVYVYDGGTFTMNGGVISGNTVSAASSSSYGGGVYVASGGGFIMSGGEISGNRASYSSSSSSPSKNVYAYGGGVYAGGTFTMSGGKISGNTVYSYDSNSIYGSNSRAFGGGVYAIGTFTMSGGKISGNTAYSDSENLELWPSSWAAGGGVFAFETFTMSGGEISDNTVSSFSSSSADADGGGVEAGIFTMSGGVISGNMIKTASSSYPSIDSSEGGGVDAYSFAMSGGEISGNTVSSAYIRGGGVNVHGVGIFTMSGGKISGNTASSSSTTAFAGATAVRGGGVYAEGTFTMNDGEISGNSASNSSNATSTCGGGVYVDGWSSSSYSSYEAFTMNGGVISGNTASNSSNSTYAYGGGVYVDKRVSSDYGIFTMNDGTISGNSASSGGGLYVASGRTFTMSGGEVLGNTASSGGGVYVYSGGTFTKQSDGVIYGSDAAGTLQNTASGNSYGHAVYVYTGSKKRNTTAGEGVTLDSAVAGTAGGWE